jgi:hypothetical protein
MAGLTETGSCRWSHAVPQATFIPLAVPLMLVAFVLLLRRSEPFNFVAQAQHHVETPAE